MPNKGRNLSRNLSRKQKTRRTGFAISQAWRIFTKVRRCRSKSATSPKGVLALELGPES
jgi:hypothetical protein